MTSLETYQSRLDEHAWRVFRRVLENARRVGYPEISETHLIRELLDTEEEVFIEFFRQLAIDPVTFRAQLDQQMNTRTSTELEFVRLDPNLIELLKCAWNRARANGHDRITTDDLLATFAQISESSLVRLLETFGREGNEISTAMLNGLNQQEKDFGISLSEGDVSEHSFRQGDAVRITSGPFVAFTGRVRRADPSRSTVTISINALGKQQTIELPFSDVQKLQFS